MLLQPVDLGESYVLANTALLSDFSSVIATSKDEKTIYYARQKDGKFIGTASFRYGENTPLKEENFEFDSFLRVGKNAVLFTLLLEDGGALYRYRNLETGEIKTVISDVAFSAVIADEHGKTLCGTKKTAKGGNIFIFDLKTGKEKGNYPIEFGTPGNSLAISSDAKTLLLSVGEGKDEILGTLDLTSFDQK